MKLKQIYIVNGIVFALLVVTMLLGFAGGSANGLVMPLLCVLPVFLFVSGGSVFVTIFTMKDKKLIDANEYQQLKRKQDRTANVPLG